MYKAAFIDSKLVGFCFYGSGSTEPEKLKKTLPLFGAMKGGSKFKLKTGTIGVGDPEPMKYYFISVMYLLLTLSSLLQKLPPKRPNLPAELFNMKELPPGGEEEEEEEETEIKKDNGDECGTTVLKPDAEDFDASTSEEKTCLKDESVKVKGKNNGFLLKEQPGCCFLLPLDGGLLVCLLLKT